MDIKINYIFNDEYFDYYVDKIDYSFACCEILIQKYLKILKQRNVKIPNKKAISIMKVQLNVLFTELNLFNKIYDYLSNDLKKYYEILAYKKYLSLKQEIKYGECDND